MQGVSTLSWWRADYHRGAHPPPKKQNVLLFLLEIYDTDRDQTCVFLKKQICCCPPHLRRNIMKEFRKTQLMESRLLFSRKARFEIFHSRHAKYDELIIYFCLSTYAGKRLSATSKRHEELRFRWTYRCVSWKWYCGRVNILSSRCNISSTFSPGMRVQM